MLPNFLIIGAPRAGTTWAAKNMMLHPEIFIPKEKELHFFDFNYEKGIAFYENQFQLVKDERAVGEATPDYIYNEAVPALLKEHLPDIKLIAIIRNPIDRLYSRYWHSKARYIANKDLSFEEKIAQKPLFIEEGFYYDHLLRYYQHYSKDKVLILLFEEIKSQPYEFLKKIYNFLEVDPGFISPLVEIQINSAKGKKYLAKSMLLWNLQRVMTRLKAYKISSAIEKINKNEYPEMKLETKKWLVNEIYKVKNQQLESLIGKDLSHWNQI